MKKIIISLFAFFFLIPVSSAFAFTDGVLEGLEVYSFTSSINEVHRNKVEPAVNDNNITTKVNLQNNYQYLVADLPQVKTIDSYQILGSNALSLRMYDAVGNQIYISNVTSNGKKHQINPVNGVKRIVIFKMSTTSAWAEFFEMEFYEVPKVVTVEPITNLKETHVYNSVDLSWWNPVNNTEFAGVIIEQDGKEIVKLPIGKTGHKITGLTPETLYKFKVYAIFSDGSKSAAEEISVKTDAIPPLGEVKNLKAASTHERVDLSWTLPTSNGSVLSHVNIYRDIETSFFSTLGMETVYAASTKIFETNGTYFNDLTVSENTKYEYTLTTTETTTKKESDGVSVSVKTAKKPNVEEIEGDGWEKDPSGDYIYKWTSPTKGKVKIMVGGKEFKVIQASDLQVTIPAADMKFTLFGKPDVILIPISEDGSEGKPVKPPVTGGGGGSGGGENGGIDTGDVDLPFTVIELIKGTFELMALFGKYIVVGLAILLMPLFIKILKKIFVKK